MKKDKDISIQSVIDRLKKMKPQIELGDFDNSKKNDPSYCVEWGMGKQAWLESFVYQKYIDDLEFLLNN